MRRMPSMSCAGIICGLMLLSSTKVMGLPTTVFVYNKKPDADLNTFDSNALGFILQELGLLDANGKPNIPEAQKIKDPNTGAVIGYKSADGTKEAYDVNSSATTDEAWKQVANGGMLHIIKHGAFLLGVPDFEGGGITLDGDNVFDGFKPAGGAGAGTGAGYDNGPGRPSGPYPLTPRPGANIRLNLNGCWTSKDPDGAGPVTPVTATGGSVPGVGVTTGHPGVVNVNVAVGLSGGTQPQHDEAKKRLRDEARAKGFPPKPTDGSPRRATTDDDVVAWVKDLPVESRYDTVQKIVDAGNPPTVRLVLTYSKLEKAAPPAPRRIQQPHQIPPTGGDLGFDYENGEPPELIAASLHVPPGALARPGIFLISMHGQLPSPPSSRMLASGAFLFRVVNGDPVQAPIEMSFGVYAPFSDVSILWFDPQQSLWRNPIGSVTFNGQVVTISSSETGLYAAFVPLSPVPALSTWAAAVLALLLALTGATLAARAARRRSA